MNQENRRKITQLRHQLHRYPEISMQEYRTKDTLINFIKKETDLEVTDRGHWFYACYHCGIPGAESIAFRADFDALAIPEENDLPYCSRNPGVSHRCGHDGHSAVLAGLALEVAQYGADKDVYFIFQHAEEIGGGGAECAKLISEKGISKVFAFHNLSGYPEGCVAVREGTAQCASKGLTVHLTGTPAHASQPEDGKNPSAACAELVLEINRAAACKEEYEGLIMATIVQVLSGQKNFGIAASKGEVSVTLRADYEKDMEKLEGQIRMKAEELAARDGLTVDYEESDIFPETVNDSACLELVRCAGEACGMKVVDMEVSFRASEDFGYYLKQCPGAIFYIGNGEEYPQLHTDSYDFNDQILESAAELFKKILEMA